MANLKEMHEEMNKLPKGAQRVYWEGMQEYEAKKKESEKDNKAKDNQ